jgi:hypothetical protein
LFTKDLLKAFLASPKSQERRMLGAYDFWIDTRKVVLVVARGTPHDEIVVYLVINFYSLLSGSLSLAQNCTAFRGRSGNRDRMGRRNAKDQLETWVLEGIGSP